MAQIKIEITYDPSTETLEQAVTRADAAQMLAAAGVLLEGNEPKGLLRWLG